MHMKNKKYILLGHTHYAGKNINIKKLFNGKLTSSKIYKDCVKCLKKYE